MLVWFFVFLFNFLVIFCLSEEFLKQMQSFHEEKNDILLKMGKITVTMSKSLHEVRGMIQ